MSIAAKKTAISRTPVTLVKITMDFCSRTFGVSPCTATGTKCYNTFFTCKDQTNFDKTTRVYKFTSANAPVPFPGVRPYVRQVDYVPTEIKDNLTVSGQLTVTLLDEPDGDVGIDPYVAARTSVQGTFWKKWLARNPNYKERLMEVYQGYTDEAEGVFELKAVGVIENITAGEAEIKIKAKDLLAALNDIEIPVKVDVKLAANIAVDTTAITVNSVTDLDAAGYVIIGEEIIQYTAKNGTTNQITGCTRGALSTTAATHNDKDKVGKVRAFGPDNPFDILQEMLANDAGLAAGYIDSTAFAYWRDWPATDINYKAIITEPTKLGTLYFEILDLLDAKSWIAEDNKVTIRRNVPNEPGRSYHTITDEQNIIEGSGSVDLNEKSRYNQFILYWGKTTLGKPDEVASYAHWDVAPEAEAQSANAYDDVVEKKFFCRWIHDGLATEEELNAYIVNFLARQVWRQRDAAPLLSITVEHKDIDMHTGNWARVTTDEILERDGQPVTNFPFQIVKRDVRPDGKIDLTLIKLHPRRLDFIAPDDTPDYADATAAQKEYGFITQDDGKMPDGTDGYYIY